MTLVANCGHDERGQYIGGQAGDQTGDEWCTLRWFDFGQDVVFRHPNPEVRRLIAEYAIAAANNDLIGYDMYQRLDFWYQLQASDYNPANITVPCEADCSSGVAAIVKAIGFVIGDEALQSVPISMTTFVQLNALTKAGFTAFFGSEYTRTDANLMTGDILCRQDMHTNIVVEGNGSWDVDEDIMYMQRLLNVHLSRRGWAMVNPTGVYDWHTQTPLIELCQEWMACSGDPTVAIDGSFSQGFVAALKVLPIRPGMKCIASWAVKAALVGKGYGGIDLESWDFTASDSDTLKDFQRKLGVTPTGIADSDTLFALTHWD